MPLIFRIAIILDPRFKIQEFTFLEIIYNDVEKIQETIRSFQTR